MLKEMADTDCDDDSTQGELQLLAEMGRDCAKSLLEGGYTARIEDDVEGRLEFS